MDAHFGLWSNNPLYFEERDNTEMSNINAKPPNFFKSKYHGYQCTPLDKEWASLGGSTGACFD